MVVVKNKYKLSMAILAGTAIVMLSALFESNDSKPTENAPESSEQELGFINYCLDTSEEILCFDTMEEALAATDALNAVPLEDQQVQSINESTNLSKVAETYEMGGKRFSVSSEVKAAFLKTQQSYGIPYDSMVAICGRESDCVPTKINSTTGACGLFQFMTNSTETLYEALYKYGPSNGFEDEAKLVERYVRKRDSKNRPYYGFRPVNDDAKEQLITLCQDPAFNTTLWAAYQKPHIDKYNDWLGDRTITSAEFTAMNNLGRVGLQTFIRKAWDDKKTGEDTLAVDFFKANARLYGGSMAANTTMIKHPDGRFKTVREAYAEISQYGGFGELKVVSAAALTN